MSFQADSRFGNFTFKCENGYPNHKKVIEAIEEKYNLWGSKIIVLFFKEMTQVEFDTWTD